VALVSFYGYGLTLAPALVMVTLAALAATIRLSGRYGGNQHTPAEMEPTRHGAIVLGQRVGGFAVLMIVSIAAAAAEGYVLGRLAGAFGGGIRMAVPAGYRGDLVLQTDQPNCPSLMRDGGTTVITFATNGRACTSEAYPPGFNSYDFEAVNPDGSRQKLPPTFVEMGGQSTSSSVYGQFSGHVGRVGPSSAQQTSTHPFQILELSASPLGLPVRGSSNYPATTYPILAPEALEAQRKSFLTTTDPSWDVSIDPFGYVESVCADDPNTPMPTKDVVEMHPLVTDQDVSYWTSVVKANATVFGVDKPDEFGLTAIDQPVSVGARTILAGRIATVQQELAGHPALQRWERPWLWNYDDPMVLFKVANRTTGRASICLTGHQWPGAGLPAAPAVSAEEVQQALIKYKGSPLATANEFSIKTAPVLMLTTQGLELRLVTLASLRPPHDGHWIIDAVTGEDLDSRLVAPK
jgi:hypothetical protein